MYVFLYNILPHLKKHKVVAGCVVSCWFMTYAYTYTAGCVVTCWFMTCTGAAGQ